MLFPIKPICDKKKIRKDGTSIIYIQYCFSTKHRITLNTGIAIPPDFWNVDRQIIKPNLDSSMGDSVDLNRALKRMLLLTQHLLDLAEKMEISDKSSFVKEVFKPDLDIQTLVADEKKILSYKNSKAVNTDIYYQFEDYIKCKTGKVSDKTLAIYKITASHIKDFELYRKSPITFKSFDFCFYDSFVHYLTYDYIQKRRKPIIKGLKRNSISKTIKHLRLFIKDRIKRKIIEFIDLSDFKSPEEETDAIYLTVDEIRRIYETDLSPYPYLLPYRSRFVVACLTGLRFSDFVLLAKEDLRNEFLYKKQEKSDAWVVIPLRKEAKILIRDILNECDLSINNPDFNANIKIIGKLAGINMPITFSHKKGNKDVKETKAKCDWITSHTARRSFCTNEFLAGTPVKLIMKISGHKKEQDFYKYIRIGAEEGAEVIKRLWEKREGMEAFKNTRICLDKAE